MDIYKKYNLTREELAANMLPPNLYDSIEKLAPITLQDKKLFCFGCGKFGRIFCEHAEEYEWNFSNMIFVDNNPSMVGKFMTIGDKKIPIISKGQMLSDITLDDSILITVGPQFITQLADELLSTPALKGIDIFAIKSISSYGDSKKIIMRFTKDLAANPGYCVICDSDTTFRQIGAVPRYDYSCTLCASRPRNGALVNALNRFVRDWREKNIHESSAFGTTLEYFQKHCKHYSYSHYFHGHSSGDIVTYNGINELCQNLENMSFENETFDVFITQDVFEHVLNPKAAFSEIGRVLKKGGVHIFTIPWYPEYAKTRRRAKIGTDGQLIHIETPMYHGNPVDAGGSLVTHDYGQDLVKMIYDASKMTTTVYLCENESLGLKGDFLEVFVCSKPL